MLTLSPISPFLRSSRHRWWRWWCQGWCRQVGQPDQRRYVSEKKIDTGNMSVPDVHSNLFLDRPVESLPNYVSHIIGIPYLKKKQSLHWDGDLVRCCISEKISSLFPLAHVSQHTQWLHLCERNGRKVNCLAQSVAKCPFHTANFHILTSCSPSAKYSKTLPIYSNTHCQACQLRQIRKIIIYGYFIHSIYVDATQAVESNIEI